jgi:hypothetical protein
MMLLPQLPRTGITGEVCTTTPGFCLSFVEFFLLQGYSVYQLGKYLTILSFFFFWDTIHILIRLLVLLPQVIDDSFLFQTFSL